MVFGGIPHFVTSDRSSGNSLVPVYALPGCSQNFVYTDSKFGFPLTFARFFFIDSYCFIEIFSNKKLLNIQIDTFEWISIISNVVANGAGCADPIYTSATAIYDVHIWILRGLCSTLFSKQNIIGLILYYKWTDKAHLRPGNVLTSGSAIKLVSSSYHHKLNCANLL